jgi:YidC/Oxa1 family membrane protein insertase
MIKSLIDMDRLSYARLVLIIALAATAYTLLLRWQGDYGATKSIVEISKSGEQGHTSPQKTENSDRGTRNTTDELPQLVQKMSDQELPILSSRDGNDQSEMPTSQRSEPKQISVVTDVLNLQIDLMGGHIVQARLPKYPQSLESTTGFELLSSESRYFALQTGVLGHPDKITSYQQMQRDFFAPQSKYVLKGDEPLKISLVSESPILRYEKIYTFYPNEYEFEMDLLITNKSDVVRGGYFYGQILRDGSDDPSASTGGFGLPTFNGAAYWAPEKKYNKLDFDDLTEKFSARHEGGWVAWVQHYFLSAWIPEQSARHEVAGWQTSEGNYAISFIEQEPIRIEPNQTESVSIRGYLGPKIENQLETVADGLNLAVDYGFLFMISKLLFQILSFIQSFAGNWGVAIILLTLLVKALFLWPSAISYKSMARMRKLQPQLTRLKDEYGQDRQRMSQEMIKLYQKEKVNPFGGCLPVLMQMPVFIALYWALLESVELRQAPFFGWIQDLSVMDPYFILPLLMGVSMYIQTSLNPTPPDPTQAKVMKFMPIMFTVFFLFFPAGLVLYWLTNNILSIIQQWYITRRIEAAG